MKSIFYFAVGLISGILSIYYGIEAVKFLFTFQLITGIIRLVTACALGHFMVKMFEEI